MATTYYAGVEAEIGGVLGLLMGLSLFVILGLGAIAGGLVGILPLCITPPAMPFLLF